MNDNRIDMATDIYLKSYTKALNECHNPNLAVQCAMGVLMVLMQQPQQQQVNPLLSFLIQSQMDAQKKSTKKNLMMTKKGKVIDDVKCDSSWTL